MKSLVLKIWPDKILSKKIKKLTFFDSTKLNKIIIKMYDTMDNLKGVGLAAPQVSLDLSLFVYQDYETKQKSYMINPTIIPLSLKPNQEKFENCLSFPGVTIKAKRYNNIKVTYLDSEGSPHEKEFEGITSRIIQHENDHLNGLVFTQFLSKLKRDIVNRKMLKLTKTIERISENSRKN